MRRALHGGSRRLVALCCLGAAMLPAPALAAPEAGAKAPAGTAASVVQPRSFGHVLGDVLTQRVLLQQAGQPFELSALPAPDRAGLWLERRAAQLSTDAEGRRWLLLSYQVVNAPRSLTAISLPALRLAGRHGDSLALAAWPVSIAPLTPETAFGQGALQAMQPDRPVPGLPTRALERQFGLWLAATLAVLLAWAAWWVLRNRLDKRRLPFARAWAELQRLRRSQPALALEQQPAAWRGLHHAMNTRAGWAVQAASLPRLLAEQPALQPLQTQLEAFYRESARRFFLPQTGGGEAPPPALLLPLGRALLQVERRS